MVVIFTRLSDEYRDIVTRYAGTPRSPDAMLGELRDTCARAGRQLLKLVDDGTLRAPADTPHPWLDYASDLSQAPRCVEFRDPLGGGSDKLSSGSEDAPSRAFRETLHFMVAHQGVVAPRYGRAGDRGTDAEAFLHRHVFVEAATRWLPEMMPNLDGLSLPDWELVLLGGRPIKLVSDYITWHSTSTPIEFTKACAAACDSLAELCSRQPSGQVPTPSDRHDALADHSPWRSSRTGGEPLREWRAIATAINATGSVDAVRKRLRRWNSDTNGPIHFVGRRPEVDKGELIAWIEDTKGRAEEAAATRAALPDAGAVQRHHRDVIANEQGMHTAKNPARGRTRQSSRARRGG